MAINKIESTQKKNYVECGIKFNKKSNGYYKAIIYVPYKCDLTEPKKRYELSATTVLDMREKIRNFMALSNKCDINLLFQGTLKEYALIWLSKKKEIAVKKGKIAGYQRTEYSFTKYILPKLGSINLIDFTPIILQSFINEYGSHFSKSSTDKVVTPIKQLFADAYESNQIPSNPALFLHGLNNQHYGIETKQVFSLTKEVQEKFESVCKSTFANGHLKYRLGYAYILLLNTGLRRGELLALQWKDIDFNKKQLYVNKAVVAQYEHNSVTEVLEKPKTKNSVRTIPLNNKAIDALMHLKELNKNSKWVVSTKNKQNISLDVFSSLLQKLQRKNNLPLFGAHVLRHTFATRLYEKGVRIDIISKLLGHSSTRSTYRYVHTSNEVLHEYMSKAILYNTEIELDE